MTLGAFDYLLKPLDLPQIRDLVRQAIEIRRLMNMPVEVPGTVPTETNGKATNAQSDTLVGRSAQMQEVYKAIGRVAPQDVTVLVRGESGTGKELVARAVYQHGPRASGPFLAVNCAAIPDALLESELFGHEKGAFTGADQRRIGKFEQCSGGTLFLDEIGDMSPLVQSKVLARVAVATIRTRRWQRHDQDRRARDRRHESRPGEDGRGRRIPFRSLLSLERFHDSAGSAARTARRSAATSGKVSDDLQPGTEEGCARHCAGSDGSVARLFLAGQCSRTAKCAEANAAAVGRAGNHSRFPSRRGPAHSDRNRRTEADDAQGTDLRQFVDDRLDGGTKNLYADALEFMERYVVTRVLRVCDGNQSKAARILGITRGCLRSKVRALKISIDTRVQIEGEPVEV